jgi:hypothetical protein
MLMLTLKLSQSCPHVRRIFPEADDAVFAASNVFHEKMTELSIP